MENILELYKIIKNILFLSKSNVKLFIDDEITVNRLKNEKENLEFLIKEFKDRYDKVKEEIENNNPLNFFEEKIQDKLNLKSKESILEKILRSVFSEKNDILDLIRTRIIVEDPKYQKTIEKYKEILQELTEKQSLSFVYENSIRAKFNNKEAIVEGYVLEDINNCKAYYYKITFSDNNTAKEFHKKIKTLIKGKSIKNKNLYKLNLDECGYRIFKGNNLYLKLNDNNVEMIIFEDSFLNNEYNIEKFIENLKKEDKNLGIIKSRNVYFKRYHSALNKIENKYIFKPLGLNLINPVESAFDRKVLKKHETNLPNNISEFTNINLSLDYVSKCGFETNPFIEIQIVPYYVNRLNKFNEEFNHETYERRRIAKVVSKINSLVNDRKKLYHILEFLNPLLKESVYKKEFTDQNVNKLFNYRFEISKKGLTLKKYYLS